MDAFPRRGEEPKVNEHEEDWAFEGSVAIDFSLRDMQFITIVDIRTRTYTHHDISRKMYPRSSRSAAARFLQDVAVELGLSGAKPYSVGTLAAEVGFEPPWRSTTRCSPL